MPKLRKLPDDKTQVHELADLTPRELSEIVRVPVDKIKHAIDTGALESTEAGSERRTTLYFYRRYIEEQQRRIKAKRSENFDRMQKLREKRMHEFVQSASA